MQAIKADLPEYIFATGNAILTHKVRMMAAKDAKATKIMSKNRFLFLRFLCFLAAHSLT